MFGRYINSPNAVPQLDSQKLKDPREFGEFCKPKKPIHKAEFLKTRKPHMEFQMLGGQPLTRCEKFPAARNFVRNSYKQMPPKSKL